MRVVVTGAAGQLGRDLTDVLQGRVPVGGRPGGLPLATEAGVGGPVAVIGTDLPDLDITDRPAVQSFMADARPDVVVHGAAWTAVDACEADPDRAFAVNAVATRHLVEAAGAVGAHVVYVSTDYVFDGTAPRAYREADPINPLSAYGRSKAEGEAAIRAALARHVILRTSWVFGAQGQNFVKTMLRLAGERPELRIVDDQHGCPTAAADLARVIVAVAARVARDPALWGTYHYASAGVTSWAGFAEAIFEIAGPRLARRPRITRIGTAEYPVPARRPANSELDCSLIEARFGIARIPWRDGLAAMLDEHLGSGSVPARTMAEAARS